MMMDKPEGKKGLLLALMMGRPKKTEEKETPNEDAVTIGSDDTSTIGAEAAGEELLRAIEQKDAKAVAEAFKALMSCCQDDGEDSDSAEME